MFSYLILLSFLIIVNALYNKNNIFHNKLNMLNNDENDLYTVFGYNDDYHNYLIKNIKKKKLNVIFVDKTSFTKNELLDFAKYYNIQNVNIFMEPLLFKNYDEYIGSTFEIHNIIK